jgi:hypothetical protein
VLNCFYTPSLMDTLLLMDCTSLKAIKLVFPPIQNCTVPHIRRPWSKYSLLWGPQISPAILVQRAEWQLTKIIPSLAVLGDLSVLTQLQWKSLTAFRTLNLYTQFSELEYKLCWHHRTGLVWYHKIFKQNVYEIGFFHKEVLTTSS